MLTKSKLIAPQRTTPPLAGKVQNQKNQHNYKLQSKDYTLGRWPFLFGRKTIVDKLPIDRDAKATILEIGCGTGQMLKHVAQKYPNSRLFGIDMSSQMIKKSQSRMARFSDRVTLIQAPYQKNLNYPFNQVDGIIFSYSLSMINPQWEDLVNRAWEDLRPGGWIAVVDFHNSGFSSFKKHMSKHHVRMDGHLLRYLRDHFLIHQETVKSAFAGAWSYFLFIGKKL